MQFSDLYGALRTRLVDSNDTRWSLQEKKDALNYIYQDFCSETSILRKFALLQVYDGATPSEYIGGDGNLLEVADTVFSPTIGYPLKRTTIAEAVCLDPNWETVTGTPQYFVFGDYKTVSTAYEGLQILKVWPDPGISYDDLKAEAVLEPALLTLDAQKPDIPYVYHWALIDGAAAHLVMTSNQARDLPAAQMWQANYIAKREAAKGPVSRRFNTTPVTIPTTWF